RATRAEHLEGLTAAGVPVAPVHRFQELFEEQQIAANGLIAELTHSQWGRVRQTGMLTKFSATPGRIDRAAPMLGEHTEEVLTQFLGYSAQRVAELRTRGIVR